MGWVVDGADPAADRIASFRPEAIERIRDVVPDPSFAPASLREIRAAHRDWDAGERYASALPGRTWGLLVFLLLILAALGGGAYAMTRGGTQVPRGRLVALAPVELRSHDLRLPVTPVKPHARGGAAHGGAQEADRTPPHHAVVSSTRRRRLLPRRPRRRRSTRRAPATAGRTREQDAAAEARAPWRRRRGAPGPRRRGPGAAGRQRPRGHRRAGGHAHGAGRPARDGHRPHHLPAARSGYPARTRGPGAGRPAQLPLAELQRDGLRPLEAQRELHREGLAPGQLGRPDLLPGRPAARGRQLTPGKIQVRPRVQVAFTATRGRAARCATSTSPGRSCRSARRASCT